MVVRDKEHLAEILREDSFVLLSDDESLQEIKYSMKKLLSGGHHISTRISKSLLSEVVRRNKNLQLESIGETLTKREKEISLLLTEGNSTLAIAEKLHLSRETVATHRKHILKKLGFKNTASLVHHIMNHLPK